MRPDQNAPRRTRPRVVGPALSLLLSAAGPPAPATSASPPPARRQPARPAAVVTYPAPPGVKAAPDFRAWVNGRELFLYDTDVGPFAVFSTAGPVDVVVRPTADVRRVDVRPASLGVRPEASPGEVRFRLAGPANLTVELNGETGRVLHLFAAPPERDAPAPNAPGVRVYAPGRVYDVGVVDLRGDEQVYVAGGAVVRGGFRARGGRGLRIYGRGVVDGSVLPPGARVVLLDGVRDARLEGVTLLDSRGWTVEPFRADGFHADNLKILNWHTGSDGIDLVATSHAVIEHSFVRANDDCVAVKTWGGTNPADADPPATDDGPDVTDITVRRSVFWNMPWGNALEIGFELRADRVGDVRFVDDDVIHVEHGAVLSIHNAERAEVRDVLYDDVRVEDARHKMFDLAVVSSQYSVDRPPSPDDRARLYLRGAWDGVLRTPPGTEAEHARHRGAIRDITFRNIAVVDGSLPFSVFAGYDAAHPVEGVRIENLTYAGRKLADTRAARLSAEHARGVVFR